MTAAQCIRGRRNAVLDRRYKYKNRDAAAQKRKDDAKLQRARARQLRAKRK